MAKYGAAASKRIESALHREKKGTLKSGSGRRVTSRKQAIAIALSEARETGAKVPPPPGRASKTAKRSAAKSGGGRKSAKKLAKKSAKKSAKKGAKKSTKKSARKPSARKS
jgi:hypothetical protein